MKAVTSTSLVVTDLGAELGRFRDGRVAGDEVAGPSTLTATGSVVFNRGTKVVKTVRVGGWRRDLRDSASSTVPLPSGTLPSGPLVLSASYAGTTKLRASSAANPTQATTTTVSSDAATVQAGDQVRFTANGDAGRDRDRRAASGTVGFFDGTTLLGSAALSGGSASFATAALAVGSHPVHAEYATDGTYLASTSSETQVTVDPGPVETSTTLASDANPSTAGDAVTFTATVTATGGGVPSGTVEFAGRRDGARRGAALVRLGDVDGLDVARR